MCSLYDRPRGTSRLLLVCGLLWLAWGSPLLAQDKPSRAQLPVENGAARRLEQAREFIAAAQWRDAFDALRPLFGTEGDSLVPAEPGRWIPGRVAAQAMLSRVPAEGLAEYRRRGDAAIRDRYARAVAERDEETLRSLVDNDFVSSFADEALFHLGELAFERGDLVAARRHWRKLVPANATDSDTTPRIPLLRHPDPDVDLVEVQARLVLCSIFLGEWDRAGRELGAFIESHGDGPVRSSASRDEPMAWKSRLQATLLEAKEAEGSVPPGMEPTFGGSARRTGVVPKSPDVAAKLWDMPWSRVFRLPGTPLDAPADSRTIPCYFPVIDGDRVFACDDASIYGWKLRTGEPLWGGETDRTPQEIFHLGLEDQGSLLDRNDGIVGVPHYSVTVHRGRLYARLGAIDRVHHTTSRPPSHLVCLDVATGEGKPLWGMSVDEITEAGPGWIFEGTPAVTDAGLYVSLFRPGPRPALGVACLDPQSARVRWFRPVCEGGPRWTGEEDRGRIFGEGRRQIRTEISHALVTVAEGRVYLATQMGAVVALEERTGRWAWGTTYRERSNRDVLTYARSRYFGPSPAVYQDGTLVVVPQDSSVVLGIDAETGLTRWSRPHNERVATVIGIADGIAVVSGDEIWGLDLATGRRIWGHGSREDSLEGFGRGLLAGDEILWPLKDEIRVLDRNSGRFVRTPITLADRGVGLAGNLVASQGVLLVSAPGRLTALGEQGGVLPATPLQSRSEVGAEAGSPEPRSGIVLSAFEGPPSRPVIPDQTRSEERSRSTGTTVPWWRVAWTREFDHDCDWRWLPPGAPSDDPSQTGWLCEVSRGVALFDGVTGETRWEGVLAGRVQSLSPSPGLFASSGPSQSPAILEVQTTLLRARLDIATGEVSQLIPSQRVPLPAGRDFTRRADPRGFSRPHLVWPEGAIVETKAPRSLEWRRRDGTLRGRVFLGPDDDVVAVSLLDTELVGLVTSNHRAGVWEADAKSVQWYAGPMSKSFALPVWVPGRRGPGADRADLWLVKDGLTLVRLERGRLRDLWQRDLGPGPLEAGKTVFRVGSQVLALGGADLRGFDAETGDEIWRTPVSGGHREWHLEVASPEAATVTLRKQRGEVAEFVRLVAVDGTALQRLVLPFRADRLAWQAGHDFAVVTGPRMALGWRVRESQ